GRRAEVAADRPEGRRASYRRGRRSRRAPARCRPGDGAGGARRAGRCDVALRAQARRRVACAVAVARTEGNVEGHVRVGAVVAAEGRRRAFEGSRGEVIGPPKPRTGVLLDPEGVRLRPLTVSPSRRVARRGTRTRPSLPR